MPSDAWPSELNLGLESAAPYLLYAAGIIAFFLLCSSILILTDGDLLSLAGVYTIAFLGVMSLFAFGNLVEI